MLLKLMKFSRKPILQLPAYGIRISEALFIAMVVFLRTSASCVHFLFVLLKKDPNHIVILLV